MDVEFLKTGPGEEIKGLYIDNEQVINYGGRTWLQNDTHSHRYIPLNPLGNLYGGHKPVLLDLFAKQYYDEDLGGHYALFPIKSELLGYFDTVYDARYGFTPDLPNALIPLVSGVYLVVIRYGFQTSAITHDSDSSTQVLCIKDATTNVVSRDSTYSNSTSGHTWIKTRYWTVTMSDSDVTNKTPFTFYISCSFTLTKWEVQIIKMY